MDFFISNTFWFIEGILFCIAFVGIRFWLKDRNIKMNWWKWTLLFLWLLLFAFTISFVCTSLGEREKIAAYRGGLFFGVISIITFIGLWRILGLPGKTELK